jgi:hypothetical protein
MPAARVSLEEYQQLERERDRLLDQRRLFFSVLSNESLLPTERITALFTLFSIEHERSQGRAIGGYTPACVKSIARQAGIGEDAVGKAITTLAKFGAWDKTPSRPWHDPVTDTWTSPVVLKAPGTLRENLRTIARMAPTSDERKAVTGKGKPGSRPGEKREKIDRACPTCGSLNTRLQCLDCGTITHTDELTGHEERPETPPEPQVAGTPPPQLAVHIRKGIEPQVADTPSEPPLCSDWDPDPARPDALDELKAAPQWVFWTWKERDGKRTKPPYDPATGAEAERERAVALHREVQRVAWLAAGNLMKKERSPAPLLDSIEKAQQRIEHLLCLGPASDDPVALLAEFKQVIVSLVLTEAPELATRLADRLTTRAAEFS